MRHSQVVGHYRYRSELELDEETSRWHGHDISRCSNYEQLMKLMIFISGSQPEFLMNDSAPHDRPTQTESRPFTLVQMLLVNCC